MRHISPTIAYNTGIGIWDRISAGALAYPSLECLSDPGGVGCVAEDFREEMLQGLPALAPVHVRKSQEAQVVEVVEEGETEQLHCLSDTVQPQHSNLERLHVDLVIVLDIVAHLQHLEVRVLACQRAEILRLAISLETLERLQRAPGLWPQLLGCG